MRDPGKWTRIRLLRHARRCIASSCALLLAPVAHASTGCMPAGQDTAHVSAVIDGRTLRLVDGREIRLAGLSQPRGTSAAHALEELAGDREVMLRGSDDAPDRYGRQSLFVFAGTDEAPLQALLLSRGEALYSGLVTDSGCAAELARAEAAARNSRSGIWSTTSAIKNAESPGDISALVGQFVVVEGKVVSVRQAGTTFYVNFGRRWTEGFAVTISGRMMTALEAAGLAPKSLDNRRVRVRGWVEQHGGPRIDLFRVGQLEVIADR